MRKLAFVSLFFASIAFAPVAVADPYDPHTIPGKCAKANGGHYVPGTKHRWQTYNIDAWNKCINDAALLEARATRKK